MQLHRRRAVHGRAEERRRAVKYDDLPEWQRAALNCVSATAPCTCTVDGNEPMEYDADMDTWAIMARKSWEKWCEENPY